MSNVIFNIPDDVVLIFNETFEKQDQNAIIAELMIQAVQRTRQKCSSQAALEIVERRRNAPIVSAVQIRAARKEGQL